MSSGVPTVDASRLTGSAIMTMIVETILMSKDVVGGVVAISTSEIFSQLFCCWFLYQLEL